MKKDMAMLKGVFALKAAYRELERSAPGVPRMGLVSGASGSGKTTAIDYLRKETSGVYCRAMATDTAVAFVSRLVKLCGQVPNSTRGNAPMVELVAEYLRDNELPLFVDEAEHLLSSGKLIETLRDIADLSNMPVIMIGHAGIEKRFVSRPQIHNRISQWVSFLPVDLEDATVLANQICDVRVEEDLLQLLHHEAHGCIRMIVVGLARIEAVAKTNGVKKVGLELWGTRRKFFLTHGTRAA